MADAVAAACCFRRCKLVFEVKGSTDGVWLVRRGKRCAIDAIEPTLVEEKGGCTEISFDFASGGGGRVIPGGDWVVEGLDAHIEAAEADFSGDGTTNEPTRKTSVMISQTIRKRVFSFFPMFLSPSFSCVLRQQSPAKRAAGI